MGQDDMDARETMWMTYGTSGAVLVFCYSPALGAEGEDVSLPARSSPSRPVQLHLFRQFPPTANIWGTGAKIKSQFLLVYTLN